MAIRVILSVVPFIWTIGMLPFVNKVYPMIFGIPFIAAWIIGGSFVSFGCLYILYHIHGAKKAKEEEE